MLFALGALASAIFVLPQLRIELLLAAPFVALLGSYVLYLAIREGDEAIALRSLLREPIFLSLLFATVAVVVNSLFTEIPALRDWFATSGLSR
jgi:hypothetical protein